MKYTTVENVARKMRGRLILKDDFNQEIMPTNLPGLPVEYDQIAAIIEEQEEYLDIILEQIYVLPLSGTHAILRMIIDNLTMSELMMFNFDGTSGFGGLSGDASNFGMQTKKRAMDAIGSLIIGTGVYIPDVTLPLGMSASGARRTELVGECLRGLEPQRLINYDDRTTGSLLNEDEGANFWINSTQESNNPFSSNYCPTDDELTGHRCRGC